MQIISEFDINQVNAALLDGTKLALYSLTADVHGFVLLGVGKWDRENVVHSIENKNATPGAIIRINLFSGRILCMSDDLANIVYPAVPYFGQPQTLVGCRSGALCLVEHNAELDSYLVYDNVGDGPYDIKYSPGLGVLLVSCRDGSLKVMNKDLEILSSFPIADKQLWHLLLDHDQNFVWATSYNGRLYKVNIRTGEVVKDIHLGSGAATIPKWISDGRMMVGTMGKKIKILDDQGQHLQDIEVGRTAVCYVMDMPDRHQILATGYQGQIWIFDYQGRRLAEFVPDNATRNNPLWTVGRLGDDKLLCPWSNGEVRVIRLPQP